MERADDPGAIEPLPTGLVDEIQAGNCVAFLGAGFSAAAELPGWGDLLLRLAELKDVDPEIAAHVRGCVQVGTAHALDEAAQAIEDEVGRGTLLREMAERLAHPRVTPVMEQRLRWLRGIPFRVILTTNFDGILAGELPDRDAYRSVLRPSRHRWWEARYWRGESEGTFTVKLHGDLAATRGGSRRRRRRATPSTSPSRTGGQPAAATARAASRAPSGSSPRCAAGTCARR
jgi:hypothetical protein